MQQMAMKVIRKGPSITR